MSKYKRNMRKCGVVFANKAGYRGAAGRGGESPRASNGAQRERKNPPVGQETHSSGASFGAGRKARSQYEKSEPEKADAGVPS